MKKYIEYAVVIAVAFLLSYVFIKPVQNIVNNLSAQSVAVTDGDCYAFMGVKVCPNRMKMNTATTTVCAIKSPTATSTLLRASATFSVSSTTASFVVISKATTAFATTTVLASSAFAAGAQGTLIASTTPYLGASLDGVMTFAPNTYVVVGMQGNVGTFSPTGTCNATFEVN